MELIFSDSSNIQYLSAGIVLLGGMIFIGIIFFLAFTCALRRRASRFVESAPTLMTSIGIIGTFLGIIIGLWGFDVNAIDDSIPALLAGLKTAFLTSVVGMIGAVVFKLFDSARARFVEADETAEDEVSPGQILGAIQETNSKLGSVCDALAKDSDGSLIGVVQRLRTELRDRSEDEVRSRNQFHAQLFSEMQNFAELLSKSATTAVIEALKSVIQDFNNNLTEQFGDNFKRLDDSVQKLVTWQQQYMQELEAMSLQYAEGVKAIDATQEAVVAIGEHTAVIPEHMRHINDVVTTNQHQIQELERHLQAFVTMRERAVEAMPTIDKHLSDVGESLTEAANAMKSTVLDGATGLQKSVQETNSAVKLMTEQVAQESVVIGQSLRESAVSIEASSKRAMEELDSGVTKVASDMADKFESAGGKLGQELDKNLQQIAVGLSSAATNAETAVKEGVEGFSAAVKQTNDSVIAAAKVISDESNNVANAISTSAASFETSTKRAIDQVETGVSDTVNHLGEQCMVFGNKLNEQLEGHLTHATASFNAATAAVEDAIRQGAEGFKASVEHTNDSVIASAESMSNEALRMANTLQGMATSFESHWKEALDGVQVSVSKAAEGMQASLENMAAELNKQINTSVNQSMASSEKQIQDATQRTNDAINGQLNAMEEAMGRELTRVMNEMGNALATISGQFSEDYRRLVSAMSDIVRQQAA